MPEYAPPDRNVTRYPAASALRWIDSPSLGAFIACEKSLLYQRTSCPRETSASQNAAYRPKRIGSPGSGSNGLMTAIFIRGPMYHRLGSHLYILLFGRQAADIARCKGRKVKCAV